MKGLSVNDGLESDSEAAPPARAAIPLHRVLVRNVGRPRHLPASERPSSAVRLRGYNEGTSGSIEDCGRVEARSARGDMDGLADK